MALFRHCNAAAMCSFARARICTTTILSPRSVAINSNTLTAWSRDSNVNRLPVWVAAQDKCFSTSSTNNSFMSYYKKYFKKKPTAEQYRVIDGIEKGYSLVYQGSSLNYVRGTALVLELAVAFGAVNLAGAAIGFWGYPLWITGPSLESCAYLGMFSFFVCTCGYLYRVYPIRIYYSGTKEMYEAVFFGLRPLSTRTLKIAPGEVRKKRSGYLTRHVVQIMQDVARIPGKQDILLSPENFITPVYYNKLFGY